MKNYDVIIVGGGPAGVGAAKVLENNNINFCIIDKKKFPRLKLCAGGLTNKSLTLLKELEIDITNINSWECDNVQFVSEKRNEKIPLANPILMVDRLEFDYNNISKVTNNNFFELEKIIDIQNDILITDKEKYRYKYIIFADGVNGYSRRLIKNRKFGFFVEYNSDKITNQTVFDFTAIKDGYGWIFPKKDYTTIGLGNFDEDKEDYIKLICDFSKKYNFEIDKSKILGHHIPLYSKEIYKQSVIDNKYILVGDAASLTDNLSGEGIYYALLSGKLAAESIVLSLKNKSELKKIYFNKTRGMCKSLNRRKFLSKLMYSRYGNFFIKLGLSNKLFINKINKIFG